MRMTISTEVSMTNSLFHEHPAENETVPTPGRAPNLIASPSPVVSVLIPTYNYSRYLPEAIESVLSQDLTDFELIIADDASTDDTPSRCEPYVLRDRRVFFVRHPTNLGMVRNWNWCLAQARGRYVKFLLADDKLNEPFALRQMVSVMDTHPEVALVCCARAFSAARAV